MSWVLLGLTILLFYIHLRVRPLKALGLLTTCALGALAVAIGNVALEILLIVSVFLMVAVNWFLK